MAIIIEKLERLEEIRTLIKSEKCLVALAASDPISGSVICLNPHSIMVALDDDEFFHSIKKASVIVIDGVGLYLVTRFLWRAHASRITGYSYVDFVLRKAKSVSVACIGSTQRTISRLIEVLNDRYNVKASGLSPPFVSEFSAADISSMKAYLEAENPDIVLVGITAPKQEKLAAMLLDVCDKPILCVGAVFDYMAYDSRPPTFVRKFGLEWIYRLLLNPRKMFPRVRTGITFLIYAALMQFRRISRNI